MLLSTKHVTQVIEVLLLSLYLSKNNDNGTVYARSGREPIWPDVA